MTDFLTRDIREGLEQARRQTQRRRSRLRLRVGEESFPILSFREDGFTLDVEDAPHLRGCVDIYDGARHICQALIIATAQEGSRMTYEFKRATQVTDRPPLDYSRDDDAPVALLSRD
ncbi:hypothetical protein DDZ14_10210 [Maritimibacter sp. 55A14]|uniref:hypothetical protein n=1 Tax=Maritimibacter sp. 55A14 TaxID=2174844 RepID=UPI000D61C2CA|nr:hypothetical protein [Maritimibacter sp. 55A14]PWE32428.1 hypothetical protein DDZ14_10210 [Maritimibacter sp. 55A14]